MPKIIRNKWREDQRSKRRWEKGKQKKEKLRQWTSIFQHPMQGVSPLQGISMIGIQEVTPRKRIRKERGRFPSILSPEHTSIDSIKYKVYCFLQAADISKDMEVSFVWFHEEKEILKTIRPMKMGKR